MKIRHFFRKSEVPRLYFTCVSFLVFIKIKFAHLPFSSQFEMRITLYPRKHSENFICDHIFIHVMKKADGNQVHYAQESLLSSVSVWFQLRLELVWKNYFIPFNCPSLSAIITLLVPMCFNLCKPASTELHIKKPSKFLGSLSFYLTSV